MTTSIFSLSEIAVAMSHHLEHGDLFNCVLVDSSWFQVFTPCLWRTVQYSKFTWGKRRIFATEDAIVTNSQHIRDIRSDHFPLFTALLKNCTHLHHIFVRRSCKSYLKKYAWMDEIFFPAIGRNQGLETLVIKCFPEPKSPDENYLSLFKRLLEPLRYLTTLHLTISTEVEHSAFMYLAGLTKQLRRLYISLKSISIKSEADDQNRMDTLAGQTQLKDFRLESFRPFAIDLYLIPILKISPELETLQVPNFDLTSADQLTSIIRRYCPKLCHIGLDQCGYSFTEESIADIIDSCRTSGLRSFYSYVLSGTQLQVMRQLCANGTSLVSVKIVVVGLEQFKMVQEILASCPNLQELSIDENGDDDDSGNFEVREILKKPWVCTNLELFRIPLSRIYGSIGGEESEDLVKDYHRDLYTQLAKLTRLQELKVDSSIWYKGKCQTSPRFSLESGLELLGELKELRLLSLNYMVNDTQRQELEWMCEHWPKLTRINGIDFETAVFWWDPEGDLASMPKRIRKILTPQDRYINNSYMYGVW
ncbi:hypothetical protein BGX26_008436 [Mortierella sp. AD094]|nr:hypothetical protein BGX26_008436 [Mortierella sp. AD094]